MKTIKSTIENNLQVVAFITMALILAVTFGSMLLTYGFRAW